MSTKHTLSALAAALLASATIATAVAPAASAATTAATDPVGTSSATASPRADYQEVYATYSNGVLSGLATTDADITVYDEYQRVVGDSIHVVDGKWSMQVPIGTGVGQHTWAIRLHDQSSVLASYRVTFRFNVSLAATSASTISSSSTVISGTGVNGQRVTIFDGDATVGQGFVGATDSNLWSIPVTGITVGKHTYKLLFDSGNGGLATYRDFTLTRVDGGTVEPPAAQVEPVTLTSPANPAAGYAANTPFTFSGTADKQAGTLTIRTATGVLAGTAKVDPSTGAWSWTRTTMGTSTYNLIFVTGEGTSTERKATLSNFRPAPAAPVVRALAFTNPTNPAAGYVSNTGFTFRGTASSNTTVTLQNDKGTVVARDLPVAADGTWSWTRPNMGTSVYRLTAVATPKAGTTGTATQSEVTLGAFGPQK